jgi:hypothetical protein
MKKRIILLVMTSIYFTPLVFAGGFGNTIRTGQQKMSQIVEEEKVATDCSRLDKPEFRSGLSDKGSSQKEGAIRGN